MKLCGKNYYVMDGKLCHDKQIKVQPLIWKKLSDCDQILDFANISTIHPLYM